jgi:dTDP-4-amino-4,6-dideoxygalactose transaminase
MTTQTLERSETARFKTELAQLAIFDAAPAFAEPLHVGRPNIGDREKLLARFNDMLDRRWLTNNGPFVQEFEKRLCSYLNVRNCVAMCNATVALEIAIRALDLTGEVIVPSYTFIATAHALQWQQITPVFCDIDPRTHAIDPAKVEQMITPRTSGIIGVHVWGNACDVDALAAIAHKRNLKLMFDAAHAFGCSRKGKMAGGWGSAEVFSFHGTKFFNTFEGGAVTTNDDVLAEKMRLMRNFGFAGFDRVIYIGTNGKMSEVSAAMGLTSFDSLDDFLSANKRNYDQYQRELAGLPGVSVYTYNPAEKNNHQYIVLEIDPATAGLTRDHLVDVLTAEQCLARKYFWPGAHNLEPYKSLFPHARLLLPETENVAVRVMLLPTGTATGAGDISQICSILRTALANPAEIRRQLAVYSAHKSSHGA